MRRLLAAGAASLFSLLIVLGSPGSACACSCVELSDDEAFDAADAVFTGTLTAADSAFGGEVILEFEVDEVYKGGIAEFQGVLTSDAEASCGWSPPVGEAYLVYAHLDGGELYAGLCGGSRELEDTPPALGVEGAAPVLGEAGPSDNAHWLYGLGAAALLASTGAAWWLLRRRQLRRV
ncbi:hypothetical protein [Glycomyces harbinensis]|uniref:Tissue inhibitor of metalloproteinase n=1 Tax=Glycomyces harbinensis TaxID=58114 RepID=A0A1G6TSW1_9ACTN|nr:hypothetical protein [Glycomyces harbinensis]SDD31477.1 hypothetical protein SAMN05216270_103103 [Glycomyces harbinensis]